MSISNQKKILLPIFFLSGFSALVYEVIWARMLALVFGSTFEAVSAVVAAFMAGLAMGSYFMGRWINKRGGALSTYSLTELGIGICSLALYFTIIILPDIQTALHPLLDAETRHILFPGEGYVLEFILVFVPASLMGATFPLMVKSYITSRNYVGEGISIIYTVNTLGGILGALLTGFFLIPAIGIRATVFTAVTINLMLALTAYILKKRFYPSSFASQTPALSGGARVVVCHTDPVTAYSTLLVLTLSGFASLGLQMAWTRVLTMVIGNSVYAFSTILTAFLAGIAIGSLALVRQIDRVKDKVFLLGILQLSLCLSVIASLPRMDSLPALFLSLFRNLPPNFAGTIIIEFIVTSSVVLIPTILMGAAFPVAARIYINTVDSIGEGLGRLYSFNTVGAIFGSFLTGFIFIPAIGTQKTIFLMSAVNLFSGIILILQASSLRRTARVAATSALAVLFVFEAATFRDWNINVLNRGVYLYAEWMKKLPDMGVSLEDFSKEFKLLYYREGRGGTVAVSMAGDRLSLQINGKTDAGTEDQDMVTQTMIAALPLLVHPDPKDVVIIGLGSGISLGAIERFPVERIDCLEILRGVVKANIYFSRFNHNALEDPRVDLIMADARNYLTTTDRRYDVIISEPSNPWIAGVSNLFTLEFFEIAKKKLKEDGIICQWFQLYSIDTPELKVLLNTFKSVFPHVSVWAFSPADMIILGSKKEVAVDENRLNAAFSIPEIRGELMRAGLNGKEGFHSAYLMGDSEIERFRRGAGINTDDRPIVEFEVPKALYHPSFLEKNISAIRSFQASAMP